MERPAISPGLDSDPVSVPAKQAATACLSLTLSDQKMEAGQGNQASLVSEDIMRGFASKI